MKDKWIEKLIGGGGNITDFWKSKKQYILAGLIGLGILAILWPVPSKDNAQVESVTPIKYATDSVENARLKMANELQKILSEIEGAGQVEVSITINSDGTKKYAKNTRNEKRDTRELDKSGGERNIKEENFTKDLAVSSGNALLIENEAPQVLGVLVVADGARDAKIKEKLSDATATLLNISPHKVRVLGRKEV